VSTTEYSEDINGYRNATSFTGPYAIFRTGLDLPSGAVITGLELEGCDTDPATDMLVTIFQCGVPPQGLCNPISAVGLIGTPGCARAQTTVTTNPTVDNRLYSYMLEVWDFSTAATTTFRAARVSWKRQVSPAPAVATFGDVPTSHFAFRFVEALNRAGITAGCAPGQYCPDAPVTRAQMAVFLSTALGLHWPN
jgi:hypothetical protein